MIFTTGCIKVSQTVCSVSTLGDVRLESAHLGTYDPRI